MRISHLITLATFSFSTFVFSTCSENSQKATKTGKDFLENLYTCNFKACDALCTENGREEVRWFASNLTEDDLSIISENVNIEVEDCDITGTSATVVYNAENVIVCDSLETKGHIGNKSLTVNLKNVKGNWKVDKLEW
jgi:hypothetical protein